MSDTQPSGPVLAVQGLRHRWPGADRDLIDLPALRLAAGERLLLRGDSGSGKTTLLSLAAGVLPAAPGCVKLLGQDWAGLSAGARDRRRADHIGYIFQRLNLLPYLSVIENVLLPCRFSARRAARCGPGREAPRAEAEALLRRLDLDPALWTRPAARLSVGQQQRVAAARALIGRPELVIADEPTSALDERRRDLFMALLIGVCEAAQAALLFVSHDPRLAPHFPHVLDLQAAALPEAGA